MVSAEWDHELGWNNVEIKPIEHLKLLPSCSVFHYGMEVFEGMKAFKNKDGEVLLFRPEMNMQRMLKSSARVGLPAFDPNELQEIIKQFVVMEKRWISDEKGYSLYIRPTLIATQESLGVGPTNKAMLFVIASPVGPYYPTGFKPVSLYAQDKFVRAWPGGTGDCKLGGNYGPTVPAQIEAQKHGCQQILWLFPTVNELEVTEVGTMNCFIMFKNELCTPKLDGTILPGVTRDSILKLCSKWNLNVQERRITMRELTTRLKNNEVTAMFGAGTAAIVCPIREIVFQNERFEIPQGEITQMILDEIQSIQYGIKESEWSVKCK